MVEFKNKLFWTRIISMKPCKLQGRTAGTQGGLDNRRLSQKCWWRSIRYKTPVLKKRRLNTVAFALRRSRKGWKWKYCESLCDVLGWKYKMGVKPSDSPRMGEGWCWKAMNEEQRQNEDQKWNEEQQQNELKNKIEWTTTTTTTTTIKTPSEVLPSKVPSLAVFDFSI